MRNVRLVALTLLLVFVCAFALADDDLTGLWKAKKWFGPEARGTVVLRRSGNTWIADFAGRTLPATNSKGEISFTLASAGMFRGTLDSSGAIRGLWWKFRKDKPNTPGTTSPAVLTPDGANRWQGNVDPGEDAFTLFLLLQTQADGSIHAVLRNPEFDLGGEQSVDRLARDGNKLTLIGKNFAGKEQDVASGTYDAENKAIRLLFAGRGGTYDFARENDDSTFYPRGKNPGHYTYHPPPAFDDGWPASTLEAENIDRAGIEKYIQRVLDMPMDTNESPQLHGVVIARHGKLVLEEYFHDQNRDKLHNVRSASKSLSSLLIGATMHAGAPLKLSSRVYEVMNGGKFPENLDPQKRAMKLEDLLTMSGGFFCDDSNDDAPGNEDKMWEQEDEPDFYRYTMAVPMATPPGENAVYCSAMPNLALGMAGRTAHENPMILFDRLMAKPMKFRRYIWGLDRAANPYGGGGMGLLLRDFAKIGQLMVNGGMWNGKRIVSEEFVKAAASPQYHLRKLSYGFLWWIEEYPYKNRTVRVVSARGSGGQSVTAIPDLDLVIATFGGSYSSTKASHAASILPIPRLILPAVREAGDDKNAPVLERDYTSPYGRSTDGSRITKKP